MYQDVGTVMSQISLYKEMGYNSLITTCVVFINSSCTHVVLCSLRPFDNDAFSILLTIIVYPLGDSSKYDMAARAISCFLLHASCSYIRTAAGLSHECLKLDNAHGSTE